MKRILSSLTALVLSAAVMAPAFAENTSAAAADSSAALTEAQNAYKTAKQTTDLTDYEAELKAMVEAGSLTQDQADLLLAAAKESVSLSSGVCPNCGYQFQYATTGKYINGKINNKKNGAVSTASSSDATALEQAQAAYSAARESNQLSEYEAELKSMVEAGTLTQDQADVLLTAAKETYALANGVCPSCGYEFQTTATYSYNNHGGKGHGGKR